MLLFFITHVRILRKGSYANDIPINNILLLQFIHNYIDFARMGTHTQAGFKCLALCVCIHSASLTVIFFLQVFQ